VKLLIPGEESPKKEDDVREQIGPGIHGDTRQNEDGQHMGEKIGPGIGSQIGPGIHGDTRQNEDGQQMGEKGEVGQGDTKEKKTHRLLGTRPWRKFAIQSLLKMESWNSLSRVNDSKH